MTTTNQQQFEDLEIATVDGLQQFLKNAQMQYQIGIEYETDQLIRGVELSGLPLSDRFTAVQSIVKELIQKLRAGHRIDHTDALELQVAYNDLIAGLQSVQTNHRISKSTPDEAAAVTPVIPTSPTGDKGADEADDVEKEEETGLVERHQVSDTTQLATPAPQKVKQNTVAVDIAKTTERNEFVTTSAIKPKTGNITINKIEQSAAAHEPEAQADEMHSATPERRQSDKRVKGTITSKTQHHSQNTDGSTSVPIHAKPVKILNRKERAKISFVIKKSIERYKKLQKKCPDPTIVQTLLFDEAEEGIDHLKRLLKQKTVEKSQLIAISEVATHIKHSLNGVQDAMVGATPNDSDVPIITKQVTQSSMVNKPVSFVPTSVTAKKSEISDRPVSRPITTLPRPVPEHEIKSLTRMYLSRPEYQPFILENYSSMEAFEHILDATVTSIESEAVNSIDRWLGDVPASAFSMLSEMTITEIRDFCGRPYEEILHDLQQQNIAYDTFVLWRDSIADMQKLIPESNNMTLGELYARYIVTLAMRDEGNAQ